MSEVIFDTKAGRFAPIDWFTPRWTSAFEEISPYLKTGDIILVHGRYPGSFYVEKLQGCKWGHVCMVVRREDIDPDSRHGLPELLIWESNTYMEGSAPNLWPHITHGHVVKEGPMLVSLEERLRKNQADDRDIQFALKTLNCPHKIDFGKLPALFDLHIAKKFPASDWDVFVSVYLGRNRNRVSAHPEKIVKQHADGEKSNFMLSIDDEVANLAGPSHEKEVDRRVMYCSELIAETYKQLGLLTKRYVSNAYTPLDFSDKSEIRLLANAAWSNEVCFTM